MTAFDPELVLASLSGEAGVAWARQGADDADCALLGGIALDEPTRQAARELVARNRSEFLPSDPTGWIDDRCRELAAEPIRPGVNVRATDPEPVEAAARVCAAHDAVVEINAHCRQPEMCRAGAGESLLREPDRLARQIRAASAVGATVSLKCRAEIDGVDLPAVSRRAVTAGADAIHVDAMDTEGVVARIVAAVPETTVIANNGVRDRATVREYLAYGADAVSLGRPSDDPVVRRRVARAVHEWQTDRGPERPVSSSPGGGQP